MKDDLLEKLENMLIEQATPSVMPHVGGTALYIREDGFESALDPDLVKKFYRNLNDALPKLKTRIAAKYGIDVAAKSSDEFPRQWMLRDEAIKKQISKYEWFYPLLNYLFNRTRKYRAEIWKDLAGGQNYHRVGKDDRKTEHPYSCFQTGAAFYDELAAHVTITNSGGVRGISKATAKRYLKSFVESKILIELADHHRKGKVYSDGWYLISDGHHPKKLSFLMDNAHYRSVLRNFKL